MSKMRASGVPPFIGADRESDSSIESHLSSPDSRDCLSPCRRPAIGFGHSEEPKMAHSFVISPICFSVSASLKIIIVLSSGADANLTRSYTIFAHKKMSRKKPIQWSEFSRDLTSIPRRSPAQPSSISSSPTSSSSTVSISFCIFFTLFGDKSLATASI